MVPAATINLAEVAPAATVTEAGVVSRVLLSEREMTAPPEGAAANSVRVQVLAVWDGRVVGLQASEEIAGAVRERVAVLETLPRVAVKVTAVFMSVSTCAANNTPL